MDRNGRADETGAQISSEFEALEQRLLEENPGVQAVMDIYALTQTAVDHFDTYIQVVDVRPDTRISNGSV